MTSDRSLKTNQKRRRFIIITADESIIEEFEKGNTDVLMEEFNIGTETNNIRNMHRQTTDETPHHHKKRHNGSLVCVICGASATGYNFGAIACESCKAFFRRNAFKNLATFRCRQKGVCEIRYQTRPSCPPCRLTKCFKNGMQRERIATAEQKAVKRREIEENRSLKSSSNSRQEEVDLEPSLLVPDDFSTTINIDVLQIPDFLDLLSPASTKTVQSSLRVEDVQSVENISLWYRKRIELAAQEGLPWDPSIQTTTYLQTLNSRAVSVMRLLSFYKQIPEFNQLNVSDKIILIKYNLMIALSMNSVILYNPATKQVAETATDMPWNTQFCQLLYGHAMFTTVKKICTRLTNVAKCDEIFIQFALIIVILTSGLSTADEVELILTDGIAVHRAQNHYAELLWRCMVANVGYDKTIVLYAELIFCIMSWQTVLEEMRNHIVRVLSPNDVDDLLPIIKSVFRIS